MYPVQLLEYAPLAISRRIGGSTWWAQNVAVSLEQSLAIAAYLLKGSPRSLATAALWEECAMCVCVCARVCVARLGFSATFLCASRRIRLATGSGALREGGVPLRSTFLSDLVKRFCGLVGMPCEI